MSAPPSEVTRVAELRARIRTQVRTSRQDQGLGAHITAPAVLDRLATRVLEEAASNGAVLAPSPEPAFGVP